ncbi:competence type IV pilus assembly protein ComGB [Staphylococcus canis]|uniref:Type II secretion system F family protein n=1 Tax=Staphylococcus canis TaxID=2724942 RepID=A0ABS0TA67_9STAP|nr:competence type IV pilus assembly protein ComGB [Staphylococcus canis]MBI5975646.1 type II secretion system F family protein [Staphylococcus canis]
MKQLYDVIKSKKTQKLVNKAHLIIIKRLYQLLDHGFTLAEATIFIIDQLNLNDQSYVNHIKSHLETGMDCYTLFKMLKFPRTILMQIYFAERYGTLPETLKRCHQYYEKNRILKSKLIKTVQYPLILLAIFLILIITLNFTVMPQFEYMYESMQVKISLTQIFLKQFISNFPIILVLTILLIGTFIQIFRKYLSILNIEKQVKILVKIPIFNKYYKLLMTYQITNQFILFLMNGISINDIVNIYVTQDESVFLKFLGHHLQREIKKGKTFSKILSDLNCFEHHFISYIEQGEKRDRLEIELNIYSYFLIEHIESFISNHIKWIQPIMFFLISILILSVYLVMMLPVFEMIQTIQS